MSQAPAGKTPFNETGLGRFMARAGVVMREAGSNAGQHIARAFQWNLQAVALTREEESRLAAAGITDALLQRYFAWRKSLLMSVLGPLALTALLQTIDLLADPPSDGTLTDLGQLIKWLGLAAMWSMPVAAVLAFVDWDRPARSRRFLLLGWGVGFGVPFVVALIPISWIGNIGQLTAAQRSAVGAQVAAAYVAGLLPLVMSILPGVVRACVRVKTLSPGSIVPGWMLLVAAPLSVLVWLVPVVAINALTSGILLVLALGLFVGAPLWYVWRSDLLTRPTTAAGISRIGPVQMAAAATALAGVALLVVYMFTHELMGNRILGFGPPPSEGQAGTLLRPWSLDLYKFVAEYLARSLFMTALFADVLIGACLRVRRDSVDFARSAQFREHEAAMEALESGTKSRGRAR